MTKKAEYIKAIKMMLETEGLEAANIANHKALETGLINLTTFQAAAQLLVSEFLKLA